MSARVCSTASTIADKNGNKEVKTIATGLNSPNGIALDNGAGAATVAYAELANAHHAFDITPTVRSRLAANAVADFLGVVYGGRASSLTDSLPLSATSAS